VSYKKGAGEEIQRIVNCLKHEIESMEAGVKSNISSRYYSFYLSEEISKRLKRISKKLNMISEKVIQIDKVE